MTSSLSTAEHWGPASPQDPYNTSTSPPHPAPECSGVETPSDAVPDAPHPFTLTTVPREGYGVCPPVRHGTPPRDDSNRDQVSGCSEDTVSCEPPPSCATPEVFIDSELGTPGAAFPFPFAAAPGGLLRFEIVAYGGPSEHGTLTATVAQLCGLSDNSVFEDEWEWTAEAPRAPEHGASSPTR